MLLDEAAAAYNTKIHSSTKRAPIHLAFGNAADVPDGVLRIEGDSQKEGDEQVQLHDKA